MTVSWAPSCIAGTNVMGKYQLQAITTYYSKPITWHEFLKYVPHGYKFVGEKILVKGMSLLDTCPCVSPLDHIM